MRITKEEQIKERKKQREDHIDQFYLQKSFLKNERFGGVISGRSTM